MKIFVLFALLSVAFAQESFSDEDTLRTLTEETRRKIQQSLTNVESAPGDYDKMTDDRFNCLLWECRVQREGVNKTVTEAVFKGMQKNKQFKSFLCISNAAREAFEKLSAVEEKIPENTKLIKAKALAGVTPLKLVLEKLGIYVQDLYKTKSEELKKVTSADARQKILGEVIQKMKQLEAILEQTNGHTNSAKFKFFEEFVDYVFATENSVKKIQREGSSKIQNCVNF